MSQHVFEFWRACRHDDIFHLNCIACRLRSVECSLKLLRQQWLIACIVAAQVSVLKLTCSQPKFNLIGWEQGVKKSQAQKRTINNGFFGRIWRFVCLRKNLREGSPSGALGELNEKCEHHAIVKIASPAVTEHSKAGWGCSMTSHYACSWRMLR